MSRPVFTIKADLSQEETLYYLPLGAKSKDHKERIKLAMRLRITHDDPRHATLTIKRITFSYPGTTVPVDEMDMVPERNMDPEDGKLRRGDTANWFNGSWKDANDDWRYNQVYLDTPPRRVQVNIYCEETTDPHSELFDLAPRTGDPLPLPFKVEDLADDEYIVTSAVHNYNGPPRGTQIFGHDISIQARLNGEWKTTYKANPTRNEDARIFGRPIRAQGDGIVHSIETGFWDNDYGGGNRTDHYGANRVAVIYGNLMVIYSHLKADSIVVQPGDTVWAGRKLGEGGNSGNTKGSPHLHMECRLHPSGKLCGMTFKNSWMLARDLVPADNGPGRRVRLDARGICQEKAALRPFATQFPPPGRAKASVEEIDALVAQVFGGVAKGGDGWVIVNGKLRRVPPRGIRADLLNALAALDDADEISLAARKRQTATIVRAIEKAAAALKLGG